MSEQPPVPAFPVLAGIHVFRSQEWRSLYANNTKIRVTASDLAVGFARTLEFPVGVNAMEELVEIVMTPKNLKQLLITLEQTIESYEEIFGQITLEKAFLPDREQIKRSFDALRTAIDQATQARK